MSHHPANGVQLSNAQRIGLCVLSVTLLGVLFSATQVRPDPRGFGTHQQFGFPPCSFKIMFGIPCPSCGGTTSFAHFVRGQWPSALHANAAAFLLALGSLCFVPWAVLSSLHGRLIHVTSPLKFLFIYLLIITAVSLTQWATQLMTN